MSLANLQASALNETFYKKFSTHHDAYRFIEICITHFNKSIIAKKAHIYNINSSIIDVISSVSAAAAISGLALSAGTVYLSFGVF